MADRLFNRWVVVLWVDIIIVSWDDTISSHKTIWNHLMSRWHIISSEPKKSSIKNRISGWSPIISWDGRVWSSHGMITISWYAPWDGAHKEDSRPISRPTTFTAQGSGTQIVFCGGCPKTIQQLQVGRGTDARHDRVLDAAGSHEIHPPNTGSKKQLNDRTSHIFAIHEYSPARRGDARSHD